MSPRSSFLLCSTSIRSVSVSPARAGSGRHQHSKPHTRSFEWGSLEAGTAGLERTDWDGGSMRRRGTPYPARRGSPVSRSKNPSKLAPAPVRSGSPSRQSMTMTHGVPGRRSSGERCTAPRRRGRSRRARPRAACGGFGSAGTRVGRRSGPPPPRRRPPRERRRRGSFSIAPSLARRAPYHWPEGQLQDKPIHDVFDEFKHQLPDIDPAETQEWVDSLDALVEAGGPERARFVLYKLLKRARQLHVGIPPLTQTRYINTISPEQEPFFPGDEAME